MHNSHAKTRWQGINLFVYFNYSPAEKHHNYPGGIDEVSLIVPADDQWEESSSNIKPMLTSEAIDGIVEQIYRERRSAA